MMRHFDSTFVSLAILVLLAACQISEPEITAIEGKDSLIHFEHKDFQQELSDYAVQRDPRTGNEWHVAAFHRMDAHGVVAVGKLAPGYVVRHVRTETLIGHLIPDTELVWGGTGGANSARGHMEYRFFQVADQPDSCVAFSQRSGETADDLGRKSSLMYGFFCRDESRPLTPEAAQDLIAHLNRR